jgi:hypothetical protein
MSIVILARFCSFLIRGGRRTAGTLGQAMQPLPEDCKIALRIAFDADPEDPDYQPKHFVDAKLAGQGMVFYKTVPEVISLGQTVTPHHAISLKVKAPLLFLYPSCLLFGIQSRKLGTFVSGCRCPTSALHCSLCPPKPGERRKPPAMRTFA